MSKIDIEIMERIYQEMDKEVEELLEIQRRDSIRDFEKYQYNSGRVNGAIKMLNIFSATLVKIREEEEAKKDAIRKEAYKMQLREFLGR